jgi:hypothetical protein
MRRVTKPATFHIESVSRASAGELVMTGLCFESFFGRLGEKLSVHGCHHHSLARCHEELSFEISLHLH